jgi:uncharacterized membrane protein YedE/YeeE
MVANFTPVSGLLGGMLIGVAAALLLFLNGRISGISGIVGGLLSAKGLELSWRVVYLAGLIIGAFAYILATGEADFVEMEASLPVLVLAGLLVGFGARLGSGCTSGHGVCGLARFSRRSVVATLVFFVAAILTVYLTRHAF